MAETTEHLETYQAFDGLTVEVGAGYKDGIYRLRVRDQEASGSGLPVYVHDIELDAEVAREILDGFSSVRARDDRELQEAVIALAEMLKAMPEVNGIDRFRMLYGNGWGMASCILARLRGVKVSVL